MAMVAHIFPQTPSHARPPPNPDPGDGVEIQLFHNFGHVSYQIQKGITNAATW